MACFPFILDIKFVERPSRVTQEEGHTGFFIHLLSAVRALIFLARRIQPFLSLVDREVEFCVLRPTLIGTENLYENGPNPFFLFGTKNFKALHGRLKSQRDGTGGKLTVDPPFSFRRERGTGKI